MLMGNAMTWRRIRLEIGETDEFKTGSRMHGYDLVAPLDAQGRIDEAAWRADETRARVRRFWQGEDERTGRLVRLGDNAWGFALGAENADEPTHRLKAQTLNAGAAVSVVDHSGEARPFRVAAARVLAPLPT